MEQPTDHARPANFKPLPVWLADNKQQMNKRIDSLPRRSNNISTFRAKVLRLELVEGVEIIFRPFSDNNAVAIGTCKNILITKLFINNVQFKRAIFT